MKRSTLNTVLLGLLMCALFLFGCESSDPSRTMKPAIDKFVEAWNTGNLQELDAIVDPNFRYHDNISRDVNGLEGMKKIITSFRTAYPDLKLALDDELYSGSKCAVRWTLTGTNTGAGDMPPTGKPVKFSGISILLLANGKFTDEWLTYDNAAIMQQLGFQMVPPQGEKK